ncbi:MAG TPA: hypothetical protein PLN21_09415 [Gemmatales bacterium]|nr:hypothetical protein [Gemmatales bacterium]
MAQSMPSGTNTFIPGMVQDNLIVGYSRNVEDFAVNRYAQIVPTPKNQAYYLYVDGAAAFRLTNSDLRNVVWPDGQPRPSGDNNVAEFEFKPIATTRRSYEFTVGDMAAEQADWDVISVNSGFQAVRAMTARTMGVLAALDGASWGSNTGTATSLGGGYVSAGTATSPVLKKIVNKAVQQIRKATFGAVRAKDLCMVMSPLVAETIAESQEIHSYVKESPFALAQIKGDAPGQNTNYGLPDVLYKIPVIVEDAYKVTSKRGATLASASVCDENKIYFVSRPGGLMMPYGGISYSTLQLFVREEMSVEAYPDSKNRLRQGFVTDDWGAYVVAPASGYAVTAALS